MSMKKKIFSISLIASLLCLFALSMAWAQPEPPIPPIPAVRIAVEGASSDQDVVNTIQIVALLTILSVAPAILLMVTCFTRIIVVLGFVRRALGLQQTPPNQVIVTLALFLSLYIMSPTWDIMYKDGLAPYMAGQIGVAQAWERSSAPLRAFMLRQTRQEELSLMVSMADLPRPENADQVPTRILLPAFMLSEMKSAFQMGIVIFVPFIVVDMIISSVLMSMGMIMLPPMMISLPFKVLLFVMADGWNLVIVSLIKSFR
ncbi:flagellar biosynthetic protein FliP [Dethiosulfovibrio salsuginis]|uniref:Flagellar biosynthetic protein FliP n=2 Tax=Dethiosulfovibrio salsuginis TaxID=561720 RepID=A0A1X7JNE7_9BACT|nr:flagellar biosynthetic protein FliP [Dethiosulfovibrio salsuginis]